MIRLPRFSINVLCTDSEKTCNHVKNKLMKGYIIKDSEETDDFDHIGIKDFGSIEEAGRIAKELKRNSSGKILSVSVTPL